MMNFMNKSAMPENMILARAYVPPQVWSGNLYSLEKGLCAGTVFPELYQPVSDYEWRTIYE